MNENPDQKSKKKVSISEAIEELSISPPTIYNQLKKAMSDPEVTFDQYAKIISGDTTLMARLLKIVNSPFYGLSAQVETISHAITIVGVEQLSELALVTGLSDKFEGIPSDLVNMNSFWVHSLSCGMGAQAIARKIKESNSERYYVCGMLHDIGKLLIFRKWPDMARDALAQHYSTGHSLLKSESELLGFNHQDVGRAILKAWKLPESLVEGVGFHHTPQKAQNNKLMTSIIHVADILSYEMRIGDSGEPNAPDLDPKALKLIGVDEETFLSIRGDLENQVEQAQSHFL